MRKVVELEDLAVNFGIPNKSVIQRIRDLEADDVLTGILDDRGKYIYIEKEEIESLLNCVEKKGKFTKSEMISEFSKLVRLEPKEEDLKVIEEQNNAFSNEINKEFNEMIVEEETEKEKNKDKED